MSNWPQNTLLFVINKKRKESRNQSYFDICTGRARLLAGITLWWYVRVVIILIMADPPPCRPTPPSRWWTPPTALRLYADYLSLFKFMISICFGMRIRGRLKKKLRFDFSSCSKVDQVLPCAAEAWKSCPYLTLSIASAIKEAQSGRNVDMDGLGEKTECPRNVF